MSIAQLRAVALAGLLALLLPACVREGQVSEVTSEGTVSEPSSEAAEEQTGGDEGGGRLSIATGGTGGVYFVYGGGLANEITANIEGYEATAEVTSASVDNMLLVGDGQSDIAFSLADTAADAVNGEADFTEPVEAQALANIYTNYTQLVSTQAAGIDSVEALRGRRVSVGSPGSGTEVIALRILAAAGLDPDADIERQQLGVAESVQAVRDGTADAFFWSGGLPTGALTDLATSNPIALVPLDEYLAPMQQEYGDVYEEATIPADSYQGLTGDVPTIGVANFLVVSPDMDEELAYQLTELLFDRQEALTQVHPEAANLDIERAQQVEPLELHPGAQRYYEENA